MAPLVAYSKAHPAAINAVLLLWHGVSRSTRQRVEAAVDPTRMKKILGEHDLQTALLSDPGLAMRMAALLDSWSSMIDIAP